MKVYFISGLGADKQMFCRIQLPPAFEIIHLPWLEPLASETFVAYAKRLSVDIDVSHPFALVGLSLGGMMAIEMNKFMQPAFTILISSVTDKQALPFWFKLAGITRIYKLVPDYFYHHPNIFTTWLFGASSREDRNLLKNVMRGASATFVRWAIPRILYWDNQFIPEKMLHLHGTADVILPFVPAAPTLPIEGGTHFMVFNRAAILNVHLKNILEGLSLSEGSQDQRIQRK